MRQLFRESERITAFDLLLVLSQSGVDVSKFRAPLTKIITEYNDHDLFFWIDENGRIIKGRFCAKIIFVWRGLQLREIARIQPNGELMESDKDEFISGTIHRPWGAYPGENPLEGALREYEFESRSFEPKLPLEPANFIALDAGGKEMPLRDSSVWPGIFSWELQYRFFCDMSHLTEQPWPDGPTITELDGTIVITEWDPQRTFPIGLYPGFDT